MFNPFSHAVASHQPRFTLTYLGQSTPDDPLGRAWQRLMADPWPLWFFAGTTLLVVFVLLLHKSLGYVQRRNGAKLERTAPTYLVTLDRAEKTDIMQMREFWLGVRDGLSGTFWQRIIGTAPYLVWCDLATPEDQHVSAVYIRVVGNPKVQSELPLAIEKNLRGLNPTAQVKRIAYPLAGYAKGSSTAYAWLRLRRNHRHPIRTDFPIGYDVRAVLAEYLKTSPAVSRVEISYRFRPAPFGWSAGAQRQVRRTAKKMEAGEARVEQDARNYARGGKKVPYGVADEWQYKLEADEFGWDGEIVVAVTGKAAAAQQGLRSVTRHYFGAFTGANSFKVAGQGIGRPPLGFPVRFGVEQVFSPAEAASLCHLAKAEDVPGLAASTSRVKTPERRLQGSLVLRVGGFEVLLPQELTQVTPLETDHRLAVVGWFGDRVLQLQVVERFKGLLVLGPPGVGKSWELAGIALGDAGRFEGVAVVDPANDLCEDIMARLSERDLKRVCYLNPKELYERGRAATINVMAGHELVPLPELQAMILAAFKAVAGTNWATANRMQSLLEAAIALVLENVEQPTIRDIFYLMTKPWYRQRMERESNNRLIRNYWRDFFDQVDPNKQGEMISPVVTRVTKLLLNPYASSLVSGAKSTVSMREIMEEAGILLVALPGAASPTGGGDPTMALIGQLLIVSIRLEAARRNLVPKEQRQAFHLIIDEAHITMNQDIEEMINLFRKLRLSLTLAFQNLNQIDEDIMKVLKASIANRIIFRGEGSETEVLAGELLGGEVEPGDVARLPNYTAYARLIHEGSPAPVCTLRTLALPPTADHPRSEAKLEQGIAEAVAEQPADGEVGRLLDLVAASLVASEACFAERSNPDLVRARDRLWQMATVELAKVEDKTFEAVCVTQAARDGYLREWLLKNPGAVATQTALVKWLSQLKYSRPLVIALAEVERRDQAIEEEEQRLAALYGNGRHNNTKRPHIAAPMTNPTVPTPATSQAQTTLISQNVTDEG